MKVLKAYVILALALSLTVGPALVQAQSQSFVEKIAVTDDAVTFHTDGHYDGFVMKVAGPDGFYMQHSFAGDQVPSLPLKHKKGMLADGSYQVSVTAQPYFSKETRAALQKVRGNDYEVRKILKEMGVEPESMQHSMNIGVLEGRFLDPFAEEAIEKGDDMGALDVAPAPGYIAPPDVSATTPQYALQTANDPAMPQFVDGTPADDSPWVEAYFKNTAPDGTETVYQGYLRPIESEDVTPLFVGYFRPVSANGTQGTWHRGYFEFSGNGFTMVDQPGLATAGHQPFDYLTDDPAQTEMRRDIVHADDVIAQFSMCIGNDCVNGESFGFDTLRLKENNVRIHFDDTSTSASFPRNDWRIVINDSSNGGQSYFRIEDSTAGRAVMEIRAGAQANAIFAKSNSVGFGTDSPVVELHVVDGDSPTLRLEQDGSSGFTAQTFDMVSNEANFFIRDVTNGSQLPFRIKPGADTDALFIAANNDIGVGTDSPDSDVHIRNTGGTDNAEILLEANSHEWQFRTIATSGDFTYRDNDASTAPFKIANGAASNFVQIGAVTGCSVTGGCAATQVTIDSGGDATDGLHVRGNITASGSITPDYVFEPTYNLESIEEHAAYMWKNKHLPTVGAAVVKDGVHLINFNQRIQSQLEELEKAHIYIEQLHNRLKELEARLDKMEAQQK